MILSHEDSRAACPVLRREGKTQEAKRATLQLLWTQTRQRGADTEGATMRPLFSGSASIEAVVRGLRLRPDGVQLDVSMKAHTTSTSF